MSTRRVPYRKFAQLVRRYDTHQLLQKVSITSAELQRAEVGLIGVRWNPEGPVRQFTLAAVARAAIVEAGNRRRKIQNRPVTDAELHHLCAEAIEVDHPDLPDTDVLSDPTLTRLIARMMYQQAMFDYSDFENLARTIGLLIEHDPAVRKMPTEADWTRVLGVPLHTYMTIIFQLCSLTNTHGGALSLEQLDEGHRLGLFAGTDLATVHALIDNHLAADLSSLREVGRAHALPGAAMWSYNPLMGHPLLREDGGRYLLPVYNYLLQKITPLGLFYTGLELLGADFPRALGDSFELYAGRHLALLETAGARVYSEITYGREHKKTVDYIVVFDEVIVLVECKGFRPTEQARAGIDAGLAGLADKVQRARAQIDTTAALLGKIPELAHIRADREIRGLVVTLEPIHNIDTFLYRDMFTPTTIESATIGAHDLERICPTLAAQPDAGCRVLQALTFDEPTPASFDRAVKDIAVQRNPVSDQLWNSWELIVPSSRPGTREQQYRRGTPAA